MADIVAMEDLPRGAKQRAARAIENVHLAYYEKGGIREAEEQLESKRESAASHIYALAQYAAKTEKKRADQIALFLGMCKYAEERYKEEHDVTDLKDALPTWAVYKSNILRGVRQLELDPAEYRTERQFRTALLEKAKTVTPPATRKPAQRAEPRGTELDQAARPPVAREGPDEKTPEDIDEFLAVTVHHDSLRVLLGQVLFEVENIQSDKVKDAEKILRRTMNELAPLVDQRKVA